MKPLYLALAALILPFPLVVAVTRAWVALADHIPPAVQAPALYAAWAWMALLSALIVWRHAR